MIAKKIYSTLKIRSFLPLKRSFCDTSDKTTNLYTDFEPMEENDITFDSFKNRYLPLLVKFGIGIFLGYIFFFHKFNKHSQAYELYPINEYLNQKVNSVFSQNLQKYLTHQIYKQNTEEVKLVTGIFLQLAKMNNVEFSDPKVFVLAHSSMGAFLLDNGHLFISNRLIQMSQEDEDELAFLIAHELALVLQGQNFKRIMKIFKNEKLWADFYSEEIDKEIAESNSEGTKFIQMSQVNKYLSFYPECIFYSNVQYRETFKLTLYLLTKAEFQLSDSIKLMKKLEEKLMNYPPTHYLHKANNLNYHEILCELI